MKNLKLLLLLTFLMTLLNFQAKAQEDQSVLITIIKTGKEITLQVVKPDNTISSEKYFFKIKEPDELIIKREMDNWLRKGYKLSQTYAYSLAFGNVGTTYVNYLLIKDVETKTDH